MQLDGGEGLPARPEEEAWELLIEVKSSLPSFLVSFATFLGSASPLIFLSIFFFFVFYRDKGY